MSFITESKKAYRQVEILEKENSDHEISMARSELESTADKALAISSMLQSKSDIGNPLEAWVQSKITKAKDYITSVHDYLKYTPGMNESFDLEENTFEKIYQMQQDGKSSEDIAKELKLNPALVKKVLGEQIELKEFTDTQIAALKKEYDPLKGKTITTAQYQQLKNILFKLKDGDLEKLQKQNIPFASTGAGSILRVRKAPVKITSVKVPGLENMAEEKIPQDYLDYLRTIVYKKVDFYEIPPKHIIQHWKDEPHKDRFKGKIIDYKEEVDMSKVTKYKMISIKGDQKEITIDREDLEKHLKLGYVIKEPLTEKVELQEKPSIKQYVVFHSDDSPTKHKDFKAYDETELNKQIGEFLKQNPGYKVYGKSPSQSVKESHFPVNTQVLYKGQKAQIIQLKEPQVGNYYVVKLDSGENVEANYSELKLVENKINEGARALVEAIAALQKKADKSGMPYSILKQVYDRGMAAWKGGHRPGAGQHQWAFARVNSFVTKSSGTWGGADSDLAKKVKGKE